MRKIMNTWNGTRSQAKAYIESVKNTQAQKVEKERKQKMATWFAKVKMEEARDVVKNNY